MIDPSLVQLIAVVIGPSGIFLVIKMIIDASKKPQAEKVTPQDVQESSWPDYLRLIATQHETFRNEVTADIEELREDLASTSQQLRISQFGLRAYIIWGQGLRTNWPEVRKNENPPELPDIQL